MFSEVIGNTGQQIFLDNVATGAEFDGKWRPVSVFTLDLFRRMAAFEN